MKCIIVRDRELMEIDEFIGYAGENRAERIKFDIPEELQGYAKKICFKTGDGCFFDILDGNTYVIKNNLTKYKSVKFYLEFAKELANNEIEIIKTSTLQLEFRDSFNANSELSEDEIQILDKVIVKLGDLEKRVTDLEETGGTPGADGKSAYDIWLEKGNTGTEEDFINSLRGTNGKDGSKGAPFKYEDFTQDQLEALRGPQGIPGVPGQDGKDGEKGDPFTYDDFTTEQLEALRGEQGPQGIPGEPGADGYTPQAGIDYFTEKEKEQFMATLKAYIDGLLEEKEPIVFNITASSYCTVNQKRDFATMEVISNTIECNIYTDNADSISKIEYSFTFGDEAESWQELSNSSWKIKDNKITGTISRTIKIADYPETTYPVHLKVKVTDIDGNITNGEPEVADITIRR